MRTWRVGTFSMGAALLLLGVYLLLSQVFSLKITNIMVSWWPFILVILGLEILLYLFFSRQEKPILKYDFLSIIFVGLLGMTGIGFAVLNSSGMLEKAAIWVDREERTVNLPALEQVVDKEIKRVVVDVGNSGLTIEGTNDREVSMFGTAYVSAGKDEELFTKTDDYVTVHEKGDTLYITVKSLSRNYSDFVDSYVDISATMLIPEELQLEVMANGNSLTVKPRHLKSDWMVEGSGSLSLQLQEKSDITVQAENVNELIGDQKKWNTIKSESAEYGDNMIVAASYKNGEGSNELKIMSSGSISLNTVK